MAAVDNINTAILNVTALIAQITANPQPSYSLDGQSVSWSEYLSLLIEKLEALQEASIYLSGPYQIVTAAVT